MRGRAITIAGFAPQAMRWLVAAVVFAAALAWAQVAPVHASMMPQAETAAPCPHHHAVAEPGLGATDHFSGCQVLCSLSDPGLLAGEMTLAVHIGDTAIALPSIIPESNAPPVSHAFMRSGRLRSSDPPLYLTAVRFLI